MKIPAHVDFVELPEAPDPATCRLTIFTAGDPSRNPHSYAIQTLQISLDEMRMERQRWGRTRLRPVYFAISGKNLLFACETDQELFARFRYFPSEREI